jgi:hypothetical protein
MSDKPTKTTKAGRKTKATEVAPQSLDSLGLDPNVVAKLRAGGKSDAETIALLRKAGLVK